MDMDADHRGFRMPGRHQPDGLILLLVLLAASLLVWRACLGRAGAPAVPEQAGVQARLIELRQAARELANQRVEGLLSREPIERLARRLASPWDRALCAVLAAEAGSPETGRSLAMDGAFPGGAAFRRCYAAAYLGHGDPPDAAQRASVQRSLRGGYASLLLEARLQAKTGPAASARLREAARAWALPRLAGLAAASLAMFLLVPAGIAVAIFLAMSSRRPRPFRLPEVDLPGRGLALVLLGWFLAFLASGLLLAPLLARVPVLRPLALPLGYGFHALVGLALFCRAEGISPTGLARRLMPGAHLKNLGWGPAMLAMAVVMVLAVALVPNPLLRQQESPQQELVNLVVGTRGRAALAVLFLTVSVAAPIFEETLFRGILLPWLGSRLEGRLGPRTGWTIALLASSLGFGAVHLQPAAIPVLSTLGLALGLAFLHTRHLGTSILVHGLWNGGIFLFYRVVMG